MMRILLLLSLAMSSFVSFGAEPAKADFLVQKTASPLISIRLMFKTGAAFDPKGKEGVAALTAALLAEGGSKTMPYEEIVRRMYPMATSFDWQVDKEMTVFTGTTHIENLQKYYALIKEMLLNPGFREEDFSRLRTDAINFLKVSLRDGNDEELGKERLYNIVYAGHPYAHHNIGAISSLEKMTIQDLKNFYSANYSQGNLLIGLAGALPPGFEEQVRKDFSVLPSGQIRQITFASPEITNGMRVEIIKRETRSTAFSLGFPIEVRRGHKDYAALALVSSWLGQHRSSNSHLYQRLREARGLNYGDYAYIEYFPRGMYQFRPDANLGRHSQIFQIWIRPVQPEHSVFALRGALYEFDKLVKNGLSKEAFESTRQFLGKFVNVLLQTQDDALGYAMDSRYYGIPEYDKYLKDELAKLTLEEVNAAIKRHLKPESLRVVIVTKDAEGLREALVSGKPSPITYNSPKSEEILEEDKIIEKFPIPVKLEQIAIVPVEEVFQ
jgi:zinc protease